MERPNKMKCMATEMYQEEGEKEMEEEENDELVYLIIGDLGKDKVKETNTKLKRMGVNYDLHQISYCNASRKLYVEIDPVKIKEVVNHVQTHLGWGDISSGPSMQNNPDTRRKQGVVTWDHNKTHQVRRQTWATTENRSRSSSCSRRKNERSRDLNALPLAPSAPRNERLLLSGSKTSSKKEKQCTRQPSAPATMNRRTGSLHWATDNLLPPVWKTLK